MIPIEILSIRRLTCISPNSAGVAIGPGIFGGIEGVRIEDVTLYNTQSAFKVDTVKGRSGYIMGGLWARRFRIKTSKYIFLMTVADGPIPKYEYVPKDGYVPTPTVNGINFHGIMAENVMTSAKLQGLKGDSIRGICMSNVTISLSKNPDKQQFQCMDVTGMSRHVKPHPCSLLTENNKNVDRLPKFTCGFPGTNIPIESVVLKSCVVHVF